MYMYANFNIGPTRFIGPISKVERYCFLSHILFILLYFNGHLMVVLLCMHYNIVCMAALA